MQPIGGVAVSRATGSQRSYEQFPIIRQHLITFALAAYLNHHIPRLHGRASDKFNRFAASVAGFLMWKAWAGHWVASRCGFPFTAKTVMWYYL